MTKTKAEQARIAELARITRERREAEDARRLELVLDLLKGDVKYTRGSLAEYLGVSGATLLRWSKRMGMYDTLAEWYTNDTANRTEDILWMMRGQVNEVEVAQRLGISVESLEMWCYRNNLVEQIWKPLTEYRLRTRDDWKGERSLLRPRKSEYLHSGDKAPAGTHRKAAQQAAGVALRHKYARERNRKVA